MIGNMNSKEKSKRGTAAPHCVREDRAGQIIHRYPSGLFKQRVRDCVDGLTYIQDFEAAGIDFGSTVAGAPAPYVRGN